MTDQATKDLLARGNVFSGRGDAGSGGYMPVDSGSRDKTDYNANIPDKSGVVYTSSDPYQQQRNPEEGEEEMIEAERDLAEDAMWKRIQQNTFTRWANEHLKAVDKNIGSLETDLSDGLRLIALIEVLSQKRMNKYNKRPVFRSQKCENVEIALKFLEREGIKIINIDSSDIVDCKLKLILGLIWTLILHYSISMPMWDGDETPQNGHGPTPKQRKIFSLMHWIQNKVPDLPIGNFTNDWNDGKAVGALVDAVAPGLCPDWPSWNPKDALQNATEAMGLADDWLNVRQLLKPEDLVNPAIDEQSMMTYLSQYPNAKLKPGAPVRPRANPNRNSSFNASRVRAYGPGIEPTGPVVGAPANFTVETFSAGKGKVDVVVLNPHGAPEPVDVRFNNDKNLTYSVSYIPKMEGPHKVVVKYSDKDIPKSPYTVNVEGHAGEASKVVANGPGLQPEGVCVNRPTYFDITTKDAGKGVPEVIILDPAGHKTTVPAKVRQIGQDFWRCEYVSPHLGLHSVNVFYAGKPIPNSPYGVRVGPTSDPKKVRAAGRGLQPTGVRVGDDATFNIYTEGAGEGVPDVRIIGPGGVNYNVQLRKVDGTTFEARYVPNKEGRYRVMITFAGHEIPKSPFDVAVGPKIKSNVVAYGPGLRGGIVGHPAAFTVETNGEQGNLSFSVAGPSQAEISCKDNEDGSCCVKYTPTAPGDYAVHVLINEQDIPNSPFMAKILPKSDFHPENVKSYGPGLQPTGVTIDTPAAFSVDTKTAGDAPLEVKVSDCFGTNVPINIIEQKDGTKKCVYIPKTTSPHTVEVNYGNVATPNSPYRVKIAAPLNPAKVQAFGPWLEGGVKPNQPTHFNVDARDAGDAELKVQVVNDATKKEVATRIIDNGDNTYSVELTATETGSYTTNLFYGGLKVPTSPKTNVNPPIDVTKVKVDGLEPSVLMNSQTEFCVDMKSIVSTTMTRIESSRIKCQIFDPRGNIIPSKLMPGNNDIYRIMYTPFEAGRHTIELLYDNVPVPGSPFVVNVKAGCDPTRVRAFGSGLQGGLRNQPAKFTVETKGAGTGGLSLAIEGPSEAKMTCIDKRDGSCDVEYTPTEAGEYDITIRFAEKHIPGSPFKVLITDTSKPGNVFGQVNVFGQGLENGQVRDGLPTEFYVDCSEAGPGKIGVQLSSSDGKQVQDVKVYDKGNGVYAVSYTAPKQGATLTANVKFADKEVAGSPFVVKVGPKSDSKAVKVTGDLAKKKVPASLPVKFQVDSRQAGHGDIVVSIMDAEKHLIQSKIHPTGQGVCDVSFVPDEIGPYQVNIKFDGKDVSGSPFQLQAQPTGDASKCQLLDMDADELEFGKQNKLTVDARNAGPGAVTCRIVKTENNAPIDVQVVESKPRHYDILYTLEDAGEYDIDVKFGGASIPDGFFSIKAGEKFEQVERRSRASQSSHLVDFSADTQDSSITQTQEFLEHIKREEYQIRQEYGYQNGNSIKEESYHSTQQSSSSTVNGSPFRQVQLSKLLLPQSVKEVEDSDGGCWQYRRPATPVEVKWDDLIVFYKALYRTVTFSEFDQHEKPGYYFYEVDIPANVDARSMSFIPTNFIQSYTVNTRRAEVRMPSGNIDKPMIEDNRDGTVSIKYDPREEGLHELAVKYNGEHVHGSPYKFHVDSISSGYVTAYGPGLVSGVSGEPAQFVISTKGAGAGGLSMAVEGPSKTDIKYTDNKDGTVSVNYVPTAPGEYKVSVRFGDKHIKGSPFFAKITGEGRKRNQISVGSCSEVTFPGEITDNDLKQLNASISAPSGLEEPCFLKRLPSGNIGISFTPREVGEHAVSVKRLGKHIQNSPFKVSVCEREVGDAKKVKLSGTGLESGKTHSENVFLVDTRNAGFGGLSVSIEGPSKAEITCTDNEDGTLKIAYKPTEPGYYIINLKFADHHVEGSPFTVNIAGEGTNRQREKIQRQRDAAPVTEVGHECQLTFKMPGLTGFDLSAQVTSPGFVTEDAIISEVEDALYMTKFTPKEIGVHTVSVRYKGIHIPGSPFQYTVGPLKDFGSHLVKAGGNGLEFGEVGVPCPFNVWTREAGSGTLAISVEGPSKATIDFKDRKDGSCDVSYTVAEPGEYRVGLKFNDRHIPDSPWKVYISHAQGDAHKLEIAQFPTGILMPDKPCQFMVRTQGAKGKLVATLIAPSNAEDDCFVQMVDPDNYSIRFYPRENGIHSIHVKFNGVHIPGSPFRIIVGKGDADPAAVHAEGNGLQGARTGQKTDFIIDTCNAGAGTLQVTIDGPSKVSMDCTEVEEGYKVRYTPLLPGDYYITVKYNHMHIVGSPFKITCQGKTDKLAEEGAQETSTVTLETITKISKNKGSGAVLPVFRSDASKVVPKGMGLKKAYIGKQNTFNLNTFDAGSNILYVGIYGPKTPVEDLHVKHQGRGIYNVNYMVKDRGEYILIIKWGEDHVPGSPFKIDC
uniref:CSON010354 protein n=1 Tax=Culicoides sonorensis TaxID=179676 RepID=A0A336KKF8_CULSO